MSTANTNCLELKARRDAIIALKRATSQQRPTLSNSPLGIFCPRDIPKKAPPLPSTTAFNEDTEDIPSVSTEENGNEEIALLSIQKKASDTSLAFAQAEVDILKAELESALKALSSSSGNIEDLKADLKSKELSLATVQLEYDLLAAELDAQSNLKGEVINNNINIANSAEATAECKSKIITNSDFIDFADFKDAPQLAISPTESTSMLSYDESSMFKTTSRQETSDVSVVDLDSSDKDEDEDEDDSLTKAMLHRRRPPSSPKFRPLNLFKTPKMFGNTNCSKRVKSFETAESSLHFDSNPVILQSLHGTDLHHPEAYYFNGRISPLTTCDSNTIDSHVEEMQHAIRIGIIENDCMSELHTAEI